MAKKTTKKNGASGAHAPASAIRTESAPPGDGVVVGKITEQQLALLQRKVDALRQAKEQHSDLHRTAIAAAQRVAALDLDRQQTMAAFLEGHGLADAPGVRHALHMQTGEIMQRRDPVVALPVDAAASTPAPSA